MAACLALAEKAMPHLRLVRGDPAGNRIEDSMRGNDWDYDLLNRITESPTATHTYNAVGDRVGDSYTGGTNTYTWRLGMLTKYESSAGSGLEVVNLFRADGMRVWRRSTAGSTVLVTRTDYDGQMPVYEQQFQSGVHTWKRWNALGARGIDAFYNSTSSSWLYPIYDVHGNVKATLTRSGGTGYATANWKQYDVWGGERSSTGSGSMFGYCGNLGHPTDPENGLIYMRARFYEPWTGRFLSEDEATDGSNWYVYCSSAPTTRSDPDGNLSIPIYMPLNTILQMLAFVFGALLMNWDMNYGAAFERIGSHMMQITSMMRAGLMDKSEGMDDLMRMHKDLQKVRGSWNRAQSLNRVKAKTSLSVIGNSLVLRALLMDIEYGINRSGLDILSEYYVNNAN
ncbi:MAG: RHS repeat-associated core domain-containing protein [Fimbriimonadaceae bacterium]|nr:RHS repeat-associated core domain-containing protein [Fimbriimonadaceae bacterium]